MKRKRLESLVIFSIPKPFTDKHIALIQTNAIRSWSQLKIKPRVILFGTDPSIRRFVNKQRLKFIPIKTNTRGTPYISDAFARIQQLAPADHYLYLNADLILPPTFGEIIQFLPHKPYLVCGQRHDLDLNQPLNFSSRLWWVKLKSEALRRATPHPKLGSDYFLFNHGAVGAMPELLVGRIGWDNWLLSYAVRHKLMAIDASDFVYVLHQQHDYSHLQTGTTVNDPESRENLSRINTVDQKTVLSNLPYYLAADGELKYRISGLIRRPEIIRNILGLILILPLMFRVMQALPGMTAVFNEFRTAISDRRLDSDQQMLKYRGESYIPLKFVNQYVEDNAKIIYPAGLPDELNNVLAAYHLYPRRLLVFSSESELDRLLTLAKTDSDTTYYVFFYNSSFARSLATPMVGVFGNELGEKITIYRNTIYEPTDSRFINRNGIILIK